MLKVSQILLRKHLSQYSEDDKDQQTREFQGAYRSAKIIIDALEAVLEEELNKLIIEDELPKRTELPQPDIAQHHNKGRRYQLRWILNRLLQSKNLNLGDK